MGSTTLKSDMIWDGGREWPLNRSAGKNKTTSPSSLSFVVQVAGYNWQSRWRTSTAVVKTC